MTRSIYHGVHGDHGEIPDLIRASLGRIFIQGVLFATRALSLFVCFTAFVSEGIFGPAGNPLSGREISASSLSY